LQKKKKAWQEQACFFLDGFKLRPISRS